MPEVDIEPGVVPGSQYPAEGKKLGTVAFFYRLCYEFDAGLDQSFFRAAAECRGLRRSFLRPDLLRSARQPRRSARYGEDMARKNLRCVPVSTTSTPSLLMRRDAAPC